MMPEENKKEKPPLTDGQKRRALLKFLEIREILKECGLRSVTSSFLSVEDPAEIGRLFNVKVDKTLSNNSLEKSVKYRGVHFYRYFSPQDLGCIQVGYETRKTYKEIPVTTKKVQIEVITPIYECKGGKRFKGNSIEKESDI